VPSLGLPDPEHLPPPETLADYEAVRLFVERARAVQPAFALRERNAEAVAQLCVRLDGIPLALELAAACLRGLSVEQVAARLERRFRLLTGGSRTALPRQRTLRAAVEWSYSLLSPAEQRLFARLAVFAGGWTLEAAEAVCAGGDLAAEDVLELLLRLVGKSLVVAEEGIAGETRYHLLETLRQYAQERLLESDEAARVQRRHGHYYMQLAEQADRELRGREQALWLQRVEAEHENLWVATHRLIEHGEAAGAARLASALWIFWSVRGHRSQGRALLGSILAALGTESTAIRASALWRTGYLMLFDGDLTTGQGLFQESLDVARQVDDQPTVAYALLGLGSAAARGQIDPAAAHRYWEEAIAIFRAVNDEWGCAWGLAWIGSTIAEHGDAEAGRPLCEQAVAMRRALGDRQGLAASLCDLAQVHLTQGNHRGARALLEEALGIARSDGYHLQVEQALRLLGMSALDQGDTAAARTYYAEALRVLRNLTAQVTTDAIVHVNGMAGAVAAERPLAALRLAGAAEAARDQINNPMSPVEHTLLARALEVARRAVSTEAADVAWQEGQAMTLEEAIAYALETSTHGP
jgi:non-specific serine/threonine protein kinase